MSDQRVISLAAILLGGVMSAIPKGVHLRDGLLRHENGGFLSRDDLCDIAEAAVMARDSFRKGTNP